MSEAPTKLIYTDRDAVLVVRPCTLRVVRGKDRGATRILGVGRAAVGTAGDNALVLSDEGVSRRHLEIQVQNKGYLVRDLDSTNGSYYRGARFRELLLEAGSEIRIGGTVLRFELGEEQSNIVGPCPSFGRLVGSSPAAQRLYGVLATVAPTDVTVLVEGETGTGKELVAEQLHRRSPRCDFPFSVVDCGAIAESLIESELFGHVKGAFTGATSNRAGIFERANGGTVFLDEIGELPLALQSRLLRVLDRRTIRRVGSHEQRSVDVRLVAATNRNLRDEVAAGRFREDLLYRVSVVRVELPPLRKRKEDIPRLARHFLVQAGAINPEAILTSELEQVLANRRWPGNIRELRNVIERALIMADSSESMGGEEGDHMARERVDRSEEETPKVVAADGHAWLARAMPPSDLERPYKEVRDLLMQQFDLLYLGRLVERHGNNISAIAVRPSSTATSCDVCSANTDSIRKTMRAPESHAPWLGGRWCPPASKAKKHKHNKGVCRAVEHGRMRPWWEPCPRRDTINRLKLGRFRPSRSWPVRCYLSGGNGQKQTKETIS